MVSLLHQIEYTYAQSIYESPKQIVIAAVDSIGVPSLSASVYKNGELVFDYAYGLNQINRKDSVYSGAPYHIGSIGKSISSTIMAYLVQERKMNWDDTIGSYFPEIASTYSSVTLKQLLTNSSGLVDLFDAEDWRTMTTAKESIYVQQYQLMVDVLTNHENKRTGEDWEYSNVNFTIAALMAYKATGLKWENLVHTYIEKNLEIQLGFGWPRDSLPQLVPKGHIFVDGRYEVWGPDHPHQVPLSIRPAGDLYTTTADLARYGYFHIEGLHQGSSGLSKEQFEILHTPILEGYAMGWNIVEGGISHLPNSKMHQHLGSGGTFKSILAIFPEADLSVAVVHNGGGNNRSLSFVYRELAKHYLPDY